MQPQIGQIAKVLKGRDAGQYVVIVGIIDERYVLIADGRKRKFQQLKRKNVIHLQLEKQISCEVADSITETQKVTNGKLRYAISKYTEETVC